MSKKWIGLGAAAFFVLILGIFGAWWLSGQPPGSGSLAGQEEMLVLYNAAVDAEKKIPTDPTSALWYNVAGQKWKEIGDRTSDQRWYKRALFILEKGLTATERKNTLLLSNAAQIALALKDYAAARVYLEEAIAVSPGEGSYYAALAELMFDRLQASAEQIIAVYDEGLRRVVGAGQVVFSRAQYFKKVGRYTEALQDFKSLLDSGIIDQGQYAAAVQEIEELSKTQAHD